MANTYYKFHIFNHHLCVGASQKLAMEAGEAAALEAETELSWRRWHVEAPNAFCICVKTSCAKIYTSIISYIYILYIF